MIRSILSIAAFAGLMGCNTPGPYFRSVPATRITVAGSTFDVRVRGRLAEAQRINPEYAPRFGPIRLRAGFAMAEVSGCKVKEVRGDQALATGLLDCGKGGPKVRPGLDPLDCIPVRGTQTTGFADLVSVDLDCYPA